MDVLEHIPFSEVCFALDNLRRYLEDGGTAYVTIPHRRSNFLVMTPVTGPTVLTVPTGYLSIGSFYRRFIRRKIWIDPDHCWEIGDGRITTQSVENVFEQTGFNVKKRMKLLYVDYWVLSKST